MKYCKSYCEEKEISTSKLNEAQRTLYYIAENMKMAKSISEEGYKHFQMAIQALEQGPCEDAISRQSIKKKLQEHHDFFVESNKGWISPSVIIKARIDEISNCIAEIVNEPSVQPKPKTGHCKECKYFEYDSVAKVDGIPLIVAHEICSRWGDGCKTKEDGYCFLFEAKESEDKE